MSASLLPASPPPSSDFCHGRFLSMAGIPFGIEWFANIDNPQTWLAHRKTLADFRKFAGMGP